MKLEDRYVVIKISDFEEAAKNDPEIKPMLNDVLTSVEAYRKSRGKDRLKCVCIEHDWPEFIPTVELIAQRVDEEVSHD